jgi:hypothetical protein
MAETIGHVGGSDCRGCKRAVWFTIQYKRGTTWFTAGREELRLDSGEVSAGIGGQRMDAIWGKGE